MVGSLPVLNATEATFECTFGRGCDGICCQNGRPLVYPEEIDLLEANLDRILPELRPEARSLVEKKGILSNRRKLGLPMVRVQAGWCIFFNQGCVLHKIGAAEGDKYRYKPIACSLFPLAKDEHDRWYVRQWGYRDEKWNLFCLNPANASQTADKALQDEIELAFRTDAATEQQPRDSV